MDQFPGSIVHRQLCSACGGKGLVPIESVEIPREVPLREIVHFVSERRGVAVRELYSPRRTQRVAHPRQEIMWLADKLTMCSLPQIGRHLGKRDHTTIIHGRDKIERDMAENPAYRAEMEAMRDDLLEVAK